MELESMMLNEISLTQKEKYHILTSLHMWDINVNVCVYVGACMCECVHVHVCALTHTHRQKVSLKSNYFRL